MPIDPTQLYSPGDFTAVRNRIFQDSLDAVRNRFPIENDRYILSLENADYENPKEYTLRDQKKAVQNDQTLSWRIKGNWVLTDKASGKVISRSSRRAIMDVPYLTQRGTFIRSGTETTLPTQMRLVPGVYSRMGEDGLAKAHINARPGTGNTVMMTLNPAKPVFKVSVGTRNYDLFPLLKHLGATDDDIKNAWGKELFKVNEDAFVNGGGWYRAKTAAEVDSNDPWEKAAKDVLGGELNEDNTTATFGKPYKKVDKDLLLASSARLIGLAKGQHTGDNRDSMENQRFFGPADFISERIRLDAGGLAKNLLWRVSRYGDTEKIPSAPLSKYVHGLFTESNLAQAIEETNLLDAYKRATMVTRMGEGGIGSLESAPMSARLVHNSYKGFIAPVEAPESLRVGLDTQIAHSARRGPDGLAYAPVIDVTTGQKVYLSTLESSKVPVAFPEYMNSKDKLIPAMIGNDIEYLPKNQVRYFIPNGDTLFSTAADFVPIKSGIKAGRLLMAQKHQTQAMSIKDRMAPYVQSLDPEGSGKSVEEVYANILGAVRSDAEGKVVKVTKDEIVVAGTDGKKHSYSLYDNYPLNRKSVVNNTAAVKPGDIVQPGQLLASSSYTDKNGVAALGTQLRSAWLSYKGWNYLDAIVVSESAAKKLTSEHFYHEGIDKDEGVNFGRDRYIAAFPSRFNREQLSTIDANGAVKPGTIVHHGDPLVLAMSLRPGGPGTGYRALHKDISSTWEHEFPGEVTDVVEGKDGMRVYVKSWVPLQVGDKLATRFANKGTCAAVIPDEKMPRDAEGRPLEILFSPTGIVSRCFDEQHQLLTRQGWTPIAMVKGTDDIFAYNPRTGKGEFQRQIQPIHSSRYSGKIYMCSNKDVDFAVTEGHRMWALTDLAEGFREVVVDDIANTHVIIPASGNDLKPLPVAIQPNDWRVLQAENVSVHCPTVPSGYVFTRRNGVITCLGNTNSAALIEAALGKVAEKTGKRYVMPGFGTDLTAFANKELADAGLTDREDVTDPDTGKKIKGIFTGNSYVTKFHHTSESKGGARATGSYTVDEQPASGGHDGAKTLGGLVLGAFAGHGASEVLKDMKLIKGQKNTDFWRDFKMGKNPVTPGVPLIYERFLASLEGSGIHITKDGDKTNVFAMTNNDVDKIARAELNSSATYDDKRFLPIRGGLFDPAIFGPEGNQWAKIKLDEPVLNPIMDDVVCNFLNLKKAELDDVLAGSKKLPNGMTGGEGLRQQLAHVNLDSLIENAKNTIRTGPPSRRDKAVKTLRWASAMKNHDATPDMFMLDAVPVLPPKYRRITRSGDLNMIADANYLYKQLLDSRDDLRQAKNAGLPDELLAYGRKRITDSFRAITGLADPTDRKLVDSDVTGLLKWVFGKGSPKMGSAQRLVIGGKLDVAGRSVINIDPRLDFDEIGMPEKQAWPLYRDFVIRKLVQAGMNPLQATRATVEHTPLAKQALIKAMSERPVIATRAPALHKFSVQAFKPKLVSGDTLKLNSVVEHAFNADFDGNCVDYDTEIFLKSTLDNSLFRAILNSVTGNKAKVLNTIKKEGKEMISTNDTVIFINKDENLGYYNGPIGALPKMGMPNKDRNGADVYELPEGTLVWSYNHETSSFGWYPATMFTVEHDCETCDVFVGGSHIKISTNESMAVFDEKTGGLIKVAPANAVDCLIPVCRALPTERQTIGSFNAGWLHGMMLGDGWFSGNYVGFTKLEKAKMDTFVERLAAEVGTDINPHVYNGYASDGNKYGDSVKIHMTDKAVVAWAADLDMYDGKDNIREGQRDRGALHKCIQPGLLLSASDDYLWGLLSGLIDSDGVVTRAEKKGTGKVVYGVNYSTCSPSLKDSIIGLAHRLHIKVGVTETLHKAGKDRRVDTMEYLVMLSGPDVQRNLDKIHCVGELESGRLADWSAQEPYRDDRDIVPLSDDEVKELRNLFPHRIDPSFYVSVGKHRVTRNGLLDRMSGYEGGNEILDKVMARARNFDISWAPVRSVTPDGKKDVFDLCVPDTKVFVVNNGPVVWDTMTYYVPVSKKAVQEAYDLMLPSKNQLAARNFKALPELQEELVSGAWLASHKKNAPVKAVFNTRAEAIAAYRAGDIDVDDNVIIKEDQHR